MELVFFFWKKKTQLGITIEDLSITILRTLLKASPVRGGSRGRVQGLRTPPPPLVVVVVEGKQKCGGGGDGGGGGKTIEMRRWRWRRGIKNIEEGK